MNTVRQNNRDVDPERVSLRGKVRRMVITLTTKALWQVAGVLLGRGGEQEAYSAEVFGGIGVFARPPSSGKPEAIVALIGNDGKTPVIVAIRDEKTRQAIAAALLEDETMIFNSKVCTHHKADGTIELRNGTPASTVEKMVKGETYRSAEDVLLTHLDTIADGLTNFVSAQTTYNNAVAAAVDGLAGAPPYLLGPAVTPGTSAFVVDGAAVTFEGAIVIFRASITAFKAAAASYLATVGRVE